MRLDFFAGLRPFSRAGAMRDVIAGVTLASMNIPQVLGYTRIAGTPVVTGLYTVLLPLIAFAAFGSSRHLVVAADSATAAIFSSSLSTMAPALSEKYMALVGMAALLTAGFLLLARILKLGFLADFLSRTVLVGFLTGVGIQVGIAMLGDMLGVAIQSHRTLVQAWEVLRGLPRLDIPTAALSALVAGSILVGHRLTPRLPVALFAVVGTIAASAAFDFAGHGIAIIGPVPGGLPTIAFPAVSLSEILALMPVAASCFVVIIAQSAATARAFALRYRERVDEDADILGLSAANAAAAVSGAFVVNGSPTQTAMADRAGARSQLAQLVFAGVVLLVLLALTGPLQYLPRCVLAAIVFTIAVGMIDAPACAISAAKVRANSSLPPAPPPWSWPSASRKASCWRSCSRCSGMCATAIARTRWCLRSMRPASASRCRRRPACRPSLGSSSIASAPICSMPTIIASPTTCARSSRTRRRRCAGSSSTPRRSPISTIRPRARSANCSTIWRTRRSA